MYKTTIGLEIHAELKTKTKMFCDSLNDPDEKHPNINICPVCMGHPGALPVINREAINKMLLIGLALNCKISQDTFFERKNYFYPDLPKGYQISQFQKPLCENGWLEIATSDQRPATSKKKIRVERIHLEEDAGRLQHPPDGKYSLVDYNRAGVPLMELVTNPDIETGSEIKSFVEELQLILRYLGASDADMEKGQMRVEVNISVSKTDKLGTKVEVKNINSIKAAAAAADYETKRQIELLEAGEKIVQETRGWDDKKLITISQRTKEGSSDYRYFPEPDLPPLKFNEPDIEEIKSKLPELPQQRRERFTKEYGLPDSDIALFITNKKLGNYFEKIASELISIEHKEKLFKLASNYLITELQKLLSDVSAEIDDIKITPEMFADFVVRVSRGEVSSSGAQTLLKEMFASGNSPDYIIRQKDLAQVSDLDTLKLAAENVIMENSKVAEDYKKGKKGALKFLIGRIMAATKGKANPQIVAELIEKILND
ncbi:MAG: glutaminyl-tRNA synthase (glutamine-hydrolyzing) subunit B [Candidatus Yanofskybacteria bacterium RIFCSPHIGHO2_01_FULL_45_42]|uniref:Aspartyl/glutamyl-tRNA(Asn/Gln) amidotransferase subunit B n=3 Tax=Candidatus Yanofskyibacteriota TaxID=1752733 RepID=A0A1F8H3X2_9BACT|nr:MAG: glutaminyl-tRNA synthase (glutamine-hydrolyzing) subunit B [Candidatus Yanofskybacteria bacterium RIFCSPHIGHO2_01_FULL_45_42]OGN15836.1 MAG: glutaminyl-tRNA synthase (glutamine-hydrolyzing) subunit B [Candidatus Yanofskybacteria bacterium RIFCSPHIGHO2_02_FULL_46_19]OGN26045.1 MAG: glutaminyl-tRNA synthase (glutamine-hydrolyzing) subunit B [Candidatus Yanofskybacteria bacterium RIFCSPLOWO2_01_FULL_45_72]OGN32274.1 MAG: glutaminyl-tRNA synthase (glutamine-hydrolyzing) subunit B [Candidatus